jgi:hypothetical protein
MIISNTKKRKGMILLVVVAFLAMFTVMGLTYLLHADNQLKNSIDELLALDMKEDPYKVIDLNPNVALNFFLEKFLYDQADNTTGGNAIRGHSLARNIYGGYVPAEVSYKAFSGIGKLNKNFVIAGSTINEWKMVNYSFNAALNPERLNDGGSGVKTSTWNAPYTYPDHNNFYLGWLKSDGTKVLPSFHREYIFGSMKPIDGNTNWTNSIGKYLTPRPRPFDSLTVADAASVAGNAIATNTLINQRISEGKLFPYPDADGMDVKNLEGYPGGNDSIWIDVGSPVYTALDGRKYKIMVAPLILDLDGRINVNVAGNVMGVGGAHGSNQGWGPWEVNLSKALLGAPSAPGNTSAITEAQQINKGYSAGGALLLPGVYGISGIPGGSGTLPTVDLISPTYSMLDFNAKSETGAGNAPISLSNSFASFPTFSSNYTSNVVNNEIGAGGSHPSFVNPFVTKGGNSKFTNNEMASLIRWSGQGSAPKATNLVNLLKNTLGAEYIYDNSTMAIRNRITTLSADIQKPTLLPYSYTAVGGVLPYVSNFTYATYPLSDTSTNPKSLPYPLGTQLAFPDVGTPISGGSKSDFPFDVTNKINGVSAIVGYVKQINLNRTLANYPQPNLDATTFKVESEVDPAIPGAIIPSFGGRFNNYLVVPTVKTALDAAIKDRQDFATEIFNGLKLATGVQASDVETIRYLAQLAANMVDYIDGDDVMTQFIWGDPALDQYVFGVELPKVVINEVYSEIRNNPSEDDPKATPPKKPTEVMVAGVKTYPATADLQCNFWIELVNPLPADVSNANSALLEQDPYFVGGTPVRAPVYKVEILDQATGKDPNLMKPDNLKGDRSLQNKIGFKGFKPDTSMDDPVAANCKYDKGAFGTIETYEKKIGRILNPIGTNYTGMEPNNTTDGQSGFLTIGPAGLNSEFPSSDPTTATAPSPYSKFQYITNIRMPELGYTIPVGGAVFNDSNINTTIAAKKHTILLRRLANPYMKPQENKALPDYNPYVTVDFVEDVPVNDAVTYSNKDKRGANGTLAPPSTVATFSDRKSYNKVQPYRSSTTMVPSALQVQLANQPQHTFLRHNGSVSTLALGDPDPGAMLQIPFKWLMHLDRKLINPLELLNVSGCKPQEVTQRFNNTKYFDSNNYKLENKAPWLDEASNLYRFLALADVQGYQQGTLFAARQIGKININNIWDKEVFNALCDANANNNFTQAEVETVFNNFLNGRSSFGEPRPYEFVPNTSPPVLTPQDKPLWGFGVGQSAGGDNWTSSARGIDNSILRGAGTGSGVFDLPAANVAGVARDSNQRKELLSKITNNITTKSNVFGVWITTGYFEVTNELTDPPTLGTEIGKIAGRNIRHRMFAIVDRTNMINAKVDLFSGFVSNANGLVQDVVGNPLAPINLGKPVLINPANNANVNLVNGMIVTLDANTDWEETVAVVLDGNGDFLFTPQKLHNPISMPAINPNPAYYQNTIKTIINRGNPGPWPGYDRTKDREVVPYAEIIE